MSLALADSLPFSHQGSALFASLQNSSFIMCDKSVH